ncbi:KedN5 family methylcobalamin-dependent radical SAM C-methyltransferase [Amycolatopsis sp. NPDC005003]
MTNTAKARVFLVQQGIWETPLESMPLASGYLKATALADDRIRPRADIRILNFKGGATASTMAHELFGGELPDVLAFSVLGWNHRTFGLLAETFKQLKPDGWVVFGGTHVAHQAERVFRMWPEVDVVVDGEGEFVFRDILRAYLDGARPGELGEITGLSYRDAAGRTVRNPARERIQDLDEISSPFLSGAMELTGADGRFRYDVALMETNRGCPYKCAFCFWGGATGQRVRAFSRERLRAELELFAKHRVHTIVLCDANFGMLRSDVEFVDDMIDLRDRYGFPRALETSWAKNKSKVFYEIVTKMKNAGMQSSFTLSLQTLDEDTLDLMNRRNMKVNEWEDLFAWLSEQGIDCYAELIWGAPGETPQSFMDGYDRLAAKVSRIAVYPMLMLPNTAYTERKEDFGIISVRGDTDDFQYVLSNNTVTIAENRRMHRFLFWARVVAEMAVFRHIWAGLRVLAGMPQSAVLRSLDAWFDAVDDPGAEPLQAITANAVFGADHFGDGVRFFYTNPAAKGLLRRWWAESVRPGLPAAVTPVLDEMFRYDLFTQPICAQGDEEDPAGQEPLEITTVRDESYYVRPRVPWVFDVPAIFDDLRAGHEPDLRPSPVTVDLYYRVDAENAVNSTNHEVIVHYMGMPAEVVLANAAAGAVSG